MKVSKIEEMKALVEELNYYRDRYYNGSTSVVKDKEYDDMFDALEKLEEETGIVLSNSPTQTVGYEVKSKLTKTTLSQPMLSLGKTKSVRDLMSFTKNKECLLMCKMDGLTNLLTYENGELVSAATRGDGAIGEDITHNAKMFSNIPLKINYKGKLEIGGEAIITYSDFEEINSHLDESKKYKNPRNLASGSVRQLDSKVAQKRNIKFIAWKVFGFPELNKQSEKLDKLQNLGFDIAPWLKYNGITNNEDYLQALIKALQNVAKTKGYPIDGLVMTFDDIAYGESLGVTSHHPNHSMAFKFYDEEATSVLRNIEWSMGKSGVLTPVAEFDPVELEGTEVSRASLHNVSICEDLQLGIGDEITVYKANMIIPQIEENLTRSNTFRIPERCPICGALTRTVKDNSTKVLMCSNNTCPGKLLGRLSSFVSKKAMNIDGLSEATLQKFIELGYVNDFLDVYNLKQYKSKLLKLERFGKKSVEKLLANIEDSKNVSLENFIVALGIPNIGRTASKEIAKNCDGDINNFIEKLDNHFNWTTLKDFGETMHCCIYVYYKENKEDILKLTSIMHFKKTEENVESFSKKVLNDKSFCITGKLIHFKNRDELVKTIENAGGKVVSSVTKKTSYLLTNDKTSGSSKNKKANDLNIPVINEDDFILLLNA